MHFISPHLLNWSLFVYYYDERDHGENGKSLSVLQRDVIFKGFLLSRCGSGALTRKEGALCPILFFFFFGTKVLLFKLVHSLMGLEEVPLEAVLFLSVETEFLSAVWATIPTCDSWGFLDETGIFTSSVQKRCQAELRLLHSCYEYHK